MERDNDIELRPRPRRIRIGGTGVFFPERVVSNHEIALSAPTDPEWVRAKLGIMERRCVAENQTTTDLAANAGREALQDAGISSRTVEMVIVATMTPDHLAPSTACSVLAHLGLRNLLAFDVSAACCGFLYALTTAAAFLESGQCENALVIGADSPSRVTDWSSRDCPYFGDGAGAVFLEQSRDESAFFISSLTSDGIGQENFILPSDGSSFEIDPKAVYKSARHLVAREADRVLCQAGLEPCDVDHVIPHQASVKLLRDIAHDTGLSFNKFWLNMDRYGNTAAATVPIALNQALKSSSVEQNDWMLLAAAGAGMTAGAALYRCH
ncbi:MAG: ketoacyl-ACP synthase III [Pseudomonadota bacterium]